MQKYKVVASKSQKKYTLIISGESESEVKSRLHKDEYSILSMREVGSEDISGNKFLFQVEKNGEIKNGVIVGRDIYKVYIKLVDELGYNVLSLYPEGDAAHNDDAKRKEILEDLKKGYSLREKKEQQKIKKEKSSGEDSFFLKKEQEKSAKLIDRALKKIEYIMSHPSEFSLESDKSHTIQVLYEKLQSFKGSTNIIKLQEIGEKALIKLAEIELKNVEEKKDEESRALLKETNHLLKEIGSKEHFVEESKDITKKIKVYIDFFHALFSSEKRKENKQKKHNKSPDTQSYDFLKTLLLLDTYKQKLSDNSKEIRKHFLLFLSPFSENETKQNILLKRSVIKQNISLLEAKKRGGVASYTKIKKGFEKITEGIKKFSHFLQKELGIVIFLSITGYFVLISLKILTPIGISFESQGVLFIVLSIIIFYVLYFLRGPLSIIFSLVFITLFYIFLGVNF